MPTLPEFADALLADTLAAITRRGRRRVGLLGYSDLCCELYADLRVRGCVELLVAVFDPRADRQGAKLGSLMLAKMATALGLGSRVIGFDAFTGFPPRRSLLDLYSDPVCEFTNLGGGEALLRAIRG